MKVKICGLKTYDEVLWSVEAGTDLIGFNFYPKSVRYLSPGECMRLVVRLEVALRGVGRRVMMVGVFVDSSPENVASILGDCNLDLAQLSGNEAPEVVAALGEKAFKALRPRSGEELEAALRAYPQRSGVPAWLVDSYRPGEFGGTGTTADWSLARQAARKYSILLAGGLTAENVAQAIQQVQPWGVDVASGVESEPGVKDREKIASFIHKAKHTEELLPC